MDLKTEIIKLLEESKNEIISNIQTTGISASGRTEKALHVVDRNGHIMLVKGEGNNAPMSTLEIGREAGKVPYTFTEIILEWMKDKGISGDLKPYKTNRPHKYSEQERSDIMAAGAIAHSIGYGGKKHPGGGTERSRNTRDDIYSNVGLEVVKKVQILVPDFISLMIKKN